jgi:hypothetical protein
MGPGWLGEACACGVPPRFVPLPVSRASAVSVSALGLNPELRSQRGRVELEHRQWLILSCYRRTACALSLDRTLGGSGAWYAMELTELLPHVARELNINWEEATRYAGLNAES